MSGNKESDWLPAIVEENIAAATGAVEYDRELIADMLTSDCATWTGTSVKEQADLLRAAANRDAAGVHTTTNTAATGMGDASIPDGYTLFPTSNLTRMAETLEHDGDEHGVARDIRAMVAASPALAAQPAPVVGNELYNLVAQAIRSTGMVTNADKWEVAESVITALSCRYGWKDEDRG